ncbi:hypothetical protein [uncultured Muribaculum sp.]|uniref:hypothetical protein n=1 Tax=uncultured Muribaculum sp. TaxID=1918613 RepID=UPI00261E8413|nr:hypothetical protein [uncultured Muribaculum sp.]
MRTDNFSEFLKAIRLLSDKGSLLRDVADAASKFDTAQKVTYLMGERSRLQSECNYWLYMQPLLPYVNVAGIIRDRQHLIAQCNSLLNQLGNKVIYDEAKINAVDNERQKLDGEQRKSNHF